jgi:hypothetical protein
MAGLPQQTTRVEKKRHFTKPNYTQEEQNLSYAGEVSIS